MIQQQNENSIFDELNQIARVSAMEKEQGDYWIVVPHERLGSVISIMERYGVYYEYKERQFTNVNGQFYEFDFNVFEEKEETAK